MSSIITDYLSAIEHAVRSVNSEEIEEIADLLFDAYLNERVVFTMGNGASAALASHMACDLGKGTAVDLGRGPGERSQPRLRIVSLTDNVALMTAYSNDLDYQDLFVEQLKNMLKPGDVVIGVSGSGSSPNVLRAMLYAREMGAVNIGFTGARLSGDRMADLCDVCVRAPLTVMEQIEDLHVVFHHAVTVMLRGRIAQHVAASADIARSRDSSTAKILAVDGVDQD